MTRAVLADTGPLYAAVDTHDTHHERAVRELSVLQHERREVVIAYPTLLEAYSLVLFRLGRVVASSWLTDVEQATLVSPIAEDYRAAAAKIRALTHQPITLFDGVVAVLASRLGLEVWSYDHHFDLMRIKVWRGA